MAFNIIPKKIDSLFALAEDMADGAATHGATIGLLQNSETRIRGDLNPARTAYQNYQGAKATKEARTKTQSIADFEGKAFIGAAKNVLMPSLGSSWSAAWGTAGFINSLAVPSTLAERMNLLASLRDYFTANPGKEIAALNVTAAIGGIRFTALSDARSAANNAVAEVGSARAAWLTARKALEKRMRGLIYELGQLVNDEDPVWHAFGLTPPASETTPDAPDGLILVLGPDNSVLASWEDVSNADYYRVYVEQGGSAGGFVAEPTTFGDNDATLGPYSPGQLIRIKVAAVSGSLEGPASAVAEITLVNNGGGPGSPAAPGAPVLTVGPGGQVSLTWTAVAGALYYKIYQLIIGPGADFSFVGNASGTSATLSSLPPGATIRVRLIATHATGDSQPGPYAEITLP